MVPSFLRGVLPLPNLIQALYKTAVQPLLFGFNPETAHNWAVKRMLERNGAMTEGAVILAFDNGGRNKARILSVLHTLDRYGEIILENGQAVVNRAA